MPAPPRPPLDPRALATFRRDAAAIIAQERGLTTAGRMRLAQAAKSAGLADDQIDEAIRSLGAAEPAAPPSAAAERFRERLRKDLSVKSRPILGPTLEAKILAAAHRKFGLHESLAGEILGQVAAELGLTRITASDAIGSLAAQIDQAAGASTWLAREAWDRLRSAGTKWGLDLEVIDAMIEERLAANRSDQERRRFWTKATLLSAVGAVAVAAVVLAGLAVARLQNSTASHYPPDAAAVGQSIPESTLTTPPWWDVLLSVDVATARGRHSAPAEVLALISSPRGEDRQAGYQRLVQHAAETKQLEMRSDLERIIAGCLALETDSAAAARLEAAMTALLPTPSGPLPDNETAFDQALWAARALGLALARTPESSERQASLVRLITAAIGPVALLSADKADRQRLLQEQAIRAWYAQLAAAAPKEPNAVAQLYPSLFERAEAILAEDDLLEADTALLLAALPAVGDHWRAYRQAIGRIVSSPDPLRPLRLVEALRRAKDEELANYLTRLLVVRSGAEPRSTARKDVVIAVRRSLAGDGAAQSLSDRWLTLEEEAAVALAANPAATGEQALRELVQFAHLTTLAIALAQGDAGLATFDARINEPPQLAPSASGAVPRAPASPGPPRLTKEQQRELSACLDDLAKATLAKTTPATRPAREAAWRRLALLAKDVRDVPPAAAAQIAAQALATHAELPRRLPTIAQLRPWRHFRLAVADKLETARLPVALQHDLVESLTAQEIAADASSATLRRVLLASVLAELPAVAGSNVPRSGVPAELLDAVQDRLSDVYFERARLLGAPPGEVTPGASPTSLAEQCLLKLAADPSATQHQIAAARHIAADSDIRYLAALQMFLVEAASQRLAARRPDRALQARGLASQLAAEPSGDVFAQLRHQEQALLQIWLLHAPDA